jgi:Fe(3+) dicitrate transport protein
MKLFLTLINAVITSLLFAQKDSIKNLKKVDVFQLKDKTDHGSLKELEGTIIFATKKNDVIRPGESDADLSTNSTRQLFQKVPGIMIWENDGTGIQTGIATRGLSPNRSWEFNMRQNGCDISSEAFGYPEAYYTPPTEAVDRIEVVRGAGSLQYGSQFGGMVNYVMKDRISGKKIGFESSQTVGNYSLFNTYNAIGGEIKGFSYYGFIHHRNADGWRQNSQYSSTTAFFSAKMQMTKRLSMGLQYTHSNYLSQQAGGLTDSLFQVDASQSSRERNWFSAPWNVLQFNSTFEATKNLQFDLRVFSTIAERNSIGFTKGITTADVISSTTMDYANRQVDRDWYSNVGTELRAAQKFSLFGQEQTFSAGVRAYTGQTDRKQKAIGSTGADYDLTIVQLNNGNEYEKELFLNTSNQAFFAEQLLKIGKRLSFVPGVRYELIQSSVHGRINTSNSGTIEGNNMNRAVILLGLGGEFKVNEKTNIYSNFSQGYRPVTYSQLTPSATTDVVDPNLRDASGYNFDAGIRGKLKDLLTFDVNYFRLFYADRIGTLSQNGSNFITNIGNSISQGMEAFVEADVFALCQAKKKRTCLKLHANYTYTNAIYTSWNNPAIAEDPTKAIEGKQVEYAPKHIFRGGINFTHKRFYAFFQSNFVDKVFTNAENTIEPNTTATAGILDAYMVHDAGLGVKISENYSLKAGLNNLTDTRYATRRAGGYPGPGMLPGNGRTFFLTVQIKL